MPPYARVWYAELERGYTRYIDLMSSAVERSERTRRSGRVTHDDLGTAGNDNALDSIGDRKPDLRPNLRHGSAIVNALGYFPFP
jgi:hypothetical protein